MPTARVNDQSIYYEDSGGDKPVLVFSHGLLMDCSMFAPQVAVLRQNYRCISWDERAHGHSTTEAIEPFSYYDSADDLAALLSHLGVEKAVLAGMSQGGYLSLRCALTHPDIVQALILIDTQAQQEEADKTPAYQQMVEAWCTQGLSDEIATTIAHIILGAGWPGTEQWQEKWRRWQPHNLLAAFACLVERDDISERLAQIQVPALVLHGEADVAISLSRARDMAVRLSQSEMLVIPNAGHAANLTHPEPVNAAITAFLHKLALS